jgi:hypothetical protein
MDVTSAKLGRSFGWFNATQFLGVLNDNIFKLLVILFLIDLQGREQATNVGATAGAIFVVPFLLFSAYAGTLADRFSKRSIIVMAKLAEVAVMMTGCVVFMLESVAAAYAGLFMMATQSAFFGPAKYGIVPELVRIDQLSRANGVLKALTALTGRERALCAGGVGVCGDSRAGSIYEPADRADAPGRGRQEGVDCLCERHLANTVEYSRSSGFASGSYGCGVFSAARRLYLRQCNPIRNGTIGAQRAAERLPVCGGRDWYRRRFSLGR